MPTKADGVTVTFRIPKKVKEALEKRAWLRSESMTTVLIRAIEVEVHPSPGAASEGLLHDLRREVRDALEVERRLRTVLEGLQALLEAP